MAGTKEKKAVEVEEPGSVAGRPATENLGGSISERIGQKQTNRFSTEKMRVEGSAPSAKVHPRILAGICELDGRPVFRGRIDVHGRAMPVSEYYADIDVTCTYCSADATKVCERTITVYELDEKPGTLIMCCDDYSCQSRHQKRFLSGSK